MPGRKLLPYLLMLCLSLQVMPAAAQPCAGNTFSVTYRGASEQSVVKCLYTAGKELLCAGNIGYLSNNEVHSDGWLGLFTASGSVVWSKRFSLPGFRLLTIRDVIETRDSGFLVSGFVQTYWGATDPLNPIPNPNWGILLRIDRYGNLLEAKKLDNGFHSGVESTFAENMLLLKDGGIVMNMVAWKRPPFQTKTAMLKMDLSGKIQWAAVYRSDTFEFRFNLYNRIAQLSNGTVVAAGIVDQRLVGRDSILKVNYYWLGIDPQTGGRRWDHCYLLRNKAGNVFFPESSVRNITELPDGSISFAAYGDTNTITVPPASSRSVNMVTWPDGRLRKTVAYSGNRPGTYTVDGVSYADGKQVLLVENGSNAFLAAINPDGLPFGSKALTSSAGMQHPAAIAAAGDHYFVAFNNTGDARNIHLVSATITGRGECRDTSGSITAYAADLFAEDDARMNYTIDTTLKDLFTGAGVLSADYPLQRFNECSSCCTQAAVSYAPKDTICTGGYVLPGNIPVTYSGNYFARFTTAVGCDSIRYYSFEVIKDPALLSAGKDTCLEGKDSVVLQATDGFEKYVWMNGAATGTNRFTVTQPGSYSVTVSNRCGVKRSSLTVYALCDEPLYMPNAFTPNNDGLNDYFGMPSASNYDVIDFRIYNRSGQLLFTGNSPGKSWDGSFRKNRQPSGTYIYHLEAVSRRTGRKKTVSGNFTLIR